MLTGKELFDGSNEMAILGMHLQHDGDAQGLETLAQHKEMAPMVEVLRASLRQDPRRRASMAQVHEGLIGALMRLDGARWPLSA